MEEQQKGKKVYAPPAISPTTKAQNWTPWVVGGVVILGLLGVGIFALKGADR
jgi:hypothetical protein